MNAVSGRFYDGKAGAAQTVAVSLEAGAGVLRIAVPEMRQPVYWPLADLRAQPDQARPDQLMLSLRADHSLDSELIGLQRLSVTDPQLITDLKRLCPELMRRDVARGTFGRVAKVAFVAVAALVLMLFVILPRMADTLAGVIPIEREVAFGKAVVAQMERVLGGTGVGSLACHSAAGDAALLRLTERLTENSQTEYDLNVSVMKHKMVNAFAAPGGQVVIMRGLLERADGPDAVAAVLAHEIGHVEARDSTRGALRAAGSAGLLSLVIGDFAGGSLAIVLADQMLNAGYTREAEGVADSFAINMLDKALIKTEGMATFFESLKGVKRSLPDLPVYLSTHPDLTSRAADARRFAKTQSGTTPSLTDAEWKALQDICG
ncbi:MAG: M48 family metallopeptidase [Sulfitobacter sp.]